jgi:DNA-directed RNA polymerase specialized sigma24 family protein
VAGPPRPIAGNWMLRVDSRPTKALSRMPEPLGSDPFEALLQRLGPDREAAGERYLQLRQRLVAVFEYRHCPRPEELADETLDRVARKLQEMGSQFVGDDPARYVFGVAWNVARESFRRPAAVPLPEGWESRLVAVTADDEDGLDESCLEGCLARLSPADKRLVLDYHQGERSHRIRGRSGLARDLGLSSNALRLKIHRITARLRDCVLACVERGGLAEAGAHS